jgi:hypothetical protein
MKKINILLVLLALIFAGCSGNNSISTDETSSSSSQNITHSSSSEAVARAPIGLYKVGALAKRLESVEGMSEVPYDIELDTIKTTTNVYFILKNNGTSDIKGLKITSDLSYFKVTPDTIQSLSTTNSSTGIDPLIKVTIEHGVDASGIGSANVLHGNHYANITISGSNADGEFSVTYTMHIFAKRMLIYVDKLETAPIRYLIIDTINNTFSSGYKWEVIPSDNWAQYYYAYVDSTSDDCELSFDEYRGTHYFKMVYNDTNSNIILPEDDVKVAFAAYEVQLRLFSTLYNITTLDVIGGTPLITNISNLNTTCATLVINKADSTEFVVK